MSVLKLSREDNGKSIEARQGDLIIVSLQEAPTTGYRWAIDNIDEKILESHDMSFRIAPGARIGGSGERSFSFRAITAGSVTLKLKLRREWVGNASTIERYSLIIKVLK